MKNDFLEEIWRVREKLAARFDNNLHRMVVHLQEGVVCTTPNCQAVRKQRLPMTR